VLSASAIELVAPAGELTARFAVDAGMVGCSLRHRGDELLGLGEGLRGYLERGAVFGIPLLYPWANRLGGWTYEAAGQAVSLDRGSPLLHGEEHCLPIHGALAASSSWTVTENPRDGDGARLRAELDFGDHDELLAVFPYPHRLELDVRLSDAELEIIATVRAAPDVAVPLSFGFHPYLSPPGAPRESWLVELPARAELALDDRGLPTGERIDRPADRFRLGERTFDDLFAVGHTPIGFAVSGGGLRLGVELRSGYRYAQLFAPAADPVICFEPMMAPVDALRSHAGLRTVPPARVARAACAITVTEP
jgi:aldose 1-epimerase